MQQETRESLKSIESLAKNVKSAQLQKFLQCSNKLKKSEMIDILKDKLCSDEMIFQFCKQFHEEVSVIGPVVESVLGCTNSERMRWTSEGKLNVDHYEDLYKWNKHLQVPYFDRHQLIFEITDSLISEWREAHHSQVKDNKKKGVESAAKTRVKNNNQRQQQDLLYQEMKNSWKGLDYFDQLCLELAYWTMWISRWAKTNELKSRSAKKVETRTKYTENKENYYKKKDLALDIISKSKLATLEFYRPEYPYKRSAYLCPKHWDDYCNDRGPEYSHLSIFDYAIKRKLSSCPNCTVINENDYYSLYYVRIEDETSKTKFSFHCPYPIGKSHFPDPSTLPSVEHVENFDSLFRFGREVQYSEFVTHSEARVIKNFNKAFDLACNCLNNT